jgi:HD superfamily phosphohydrolase
MEEWITPVLQSPEVQRLSRIRLLNSSPRDLPALSEARRYSHSVAVTALAARLARGQLSDYSEAARRNFVVAAALHDVATPPFGHTFEYLLNAINGWRHEGAVDQLISGTYHPTGRFAQIIPGRSLELRSTLDSLGIVESDVTGLIQGDGELGSLIAGTLDLDNLDNVLRMAVMLGLLPAGFRRNELLKALRPANGAVGVTEAGLDLVDEWADLRRKVYQVLAFDESNLQAQAMLTEALAIGMTTGVVRPEHWSLNDETLLALLSSHGSTSRTVNRLMAGDLYRPVFVGWYGQGVDDGRDLRHPSARNEISARLRKRLKIEVCPYVFYDRGSFSKRLPLHVHHSDGTVSESVKGERSNSVIVGIFSPVGKRILDSEPQIVVRELDEMGLHPESLRRIPTKREIYGLTGQQVLPL